jgi:hypothetical protein
VFNGIVQDRLQQKKQIIINMTNITHIDDQTEKSHMRNTSTKSPSYSTITQLPIEILSEIISYFKFKHIMNTICLLNHQFHELILDKDTNFWNHYCHYQSIEFNYGVNYLPFVNTYKPTNVKLNEVLVSAIECIEPFVKKLQVRNESYFAQLDGDKFPRLTSLLSYTSESLVLNWFSDLKQFKEIALRYVSDELRLKNLCSLETLYVENVFDDIDSISSLTSLIQQNNQTLKMLKIERYEAEPEKLFECIAPIISYLTIRVDNDLLLKPKIFSRLRRLELLADAHQITSFFSVSHPLLQYIDITTTPQQSIIHPSRIVLQPAIKYCVYQGSATLLKSLLSNLGIDLKHFESSVLVNLSRFSKLKHLILQYQIIVNSRFLTEVIKKNRLTMLKLKSITSKFIQVYRLSMRHLRYITLDSLDSFALYELLRLPNLVHLKGEVFEGSFAKFTRTAANFEDICNISIHTFDTIALKGESIYLLPFMHKLCVSSILLETKSRCYWNYDMKWFLVLVSTMNVTKLKTTVSVEKIVKSVFRFYSSSKYYSPYDCFVDSLKYLFKEALEKKYLCVKDKTEVKQWLDTILQLDRLKDKDKCHPFIVNIVTKMMDTKFNDE